MNNRKPAEGRVNLPQETETPLTAFETPFGTALCLYYRSIDSIQASTIGQDYLVYRYGASDLAFAVCDGVGQSFMGDLAARLLGDFLIDWLWTLRRPKNAEAFAQAVTESLKGYTAVSAPKVAAYELPAHLPPILVQALDNQRRYGSESMFVAGRLALGGSDPWVALCWLGDSPVAAIDIDGKLVDLGPKGHTSERWNATTGVKGEVHTWVSSAKNVARVAGYTDGLGLAHAPTDAELARLMEEWRSSPPADDASLFDVRLAPSPQTSGLPSEPEDDKARPLETDGRRTPVSAMKPLKAIPPGKPTVEGWRPLIEKKDKPGLNLGDIAALGDLSAQQQIRVWQQAALLGLTSAALAMLMLERLIADEEARKGKPDQHAT